MITGELHATETVQIRMRTSPLPFYTLIASTEERTRGKIKPLSSGKVKPQRQNLMLHRLNFK